MTPNLSCRSPFPGSHILYPDISYLCDLFPSASYFPALQGIAVQDTIYVVLCRSSCLRVGLLFVIMRVPCTYLSANGSLDCVIVYTRDGKEIGRAHV